MLQVSHANVSILGLNFLMLQPLFFRCCRHVMLGVANIFFNVLNVAFRCCGHVVLGVGLRRREKRLLMLDVARNMSRNMTAI
jgi:hypothetical protein